VQYTSIMDEHVAVRSRAGLFDIAHMGEIWVTGSSSLSFLNGLLTNDLRKLGIGQGQYTLMPNEAGGVIDDLYAYCLATDEYLLIVNASRIEADVSWLTLQHNLFPAKAHVNVRNASDQVGAIAVQGPAVSGFIDRVPDSGTPNALAKNEIGKFAFLGKPIWMGRTGYTGEDGFEIVAENDFLESLWNHLLKVGTPAGLKPAGLGARDTLRTEMCYPLYGHELDEKITPIEAGVGFFVALEKGPFMGREVMAKQKADGPMRKCVAFKMQEKSAPPRPGYPITLGSEIVGQVASGTQSPSLGIGIGMGFVPSAIAKAGTAISIEVRGRQYPAVISPKPLYRKAG
jgi:aminomethyltransferase